MSDGQLPQNHVLAGAQKLRATCARSFCRGCPIQLLQMYIRCLSHFDPQWGYIPTSPQNWEEEGHGGVERLSIACPTTSWFTRIPITKAILSYYYSHLHGNRQVRGPNGIDANWHANGPLQGDDAARGLILVLGGEEVVQNSVRQDEPIPVPLLHVCCHTPHP